MVVKEEQIFVMWPSDQTERYHASCWPFLGGKKIKAGFEPNDTIRQKKSWKS